MMPVLSADQVLPRLARAIEPGPLESVRNAAGDLSRATHPGRAAHDVVENTAILFADIVGFSRLSEALSPRKVLRVLRRFHARMAAKVRAHEGEIISYIGDGLMATFGPHRCGRQCAANALICAFDMLSAIDAWSAVRAAEGKSAIAVGVGIHYGAVVSGPIGILGHRQHAVVGDAVNVAKRLESMTRAVGSPLVVSDALVDAIECDPAANRRLLAGLRPQGPSEVRGRCSPISIWTLDSAPAAAPPLFPTEAHWAAASL